MVRFRVKGGEVDGLLVFIDCLPHSAFISVEETQARVGMGKVFIEFHRLEEVLLCFLGVASLVIEDAKVDMCVGGMTIPA